MIDIRKIALYVTLIVGSAVLAFAQHDVSNTVTQDQAAPPEAAAVDNAGGRQFPAGWSLSAAASVMEYFDTNPLLMSVPSSDSGEQYLGRIDVTNLGNRNTYTASYMPTYFGYRRFSKLNSFSHRFEQTFSHTFSKKNALDWSVTAQRGSTWSNTNSLAGSSMGGLIMSLTGLTQGDLASIVSSVRTDIGLRHTINRRSNIRFSMSGGVFRYSRASDNPFAGLFMQPNSNTWTGNAAVSYDYQLDKRRSIGIGAGHSYMVNTLFGYRQHVDSVSLRYSQTFQNNWSVSVSVGPSFVIGGDKTPSVYFDMLASHASKRGVFHADVRHTFQPGIEPGQVTSWGGNASYEYALSKHWIMGLSGTYQRSAGMKSTVLTGGKAAQAFLVAGQVGYRIRPHVTWFANYGYSLQSVLVTDYVRRSRQQITTGLSFEFDGLLRQ